MPKFIQRLYPERTWAFPSEKNSVYLTFDDGPIPEITPWVLDELTKHNAKATFFCIGENIKKHPNIFRRIIADGHAVGNHTFNHLNGWKTETARYVENAEKARKQMWNDGINNQQSTINNQQVLLRPPYGKITSKQAKILQEQGYKIVMWQVLSYDYNAKISEEKCLQNVLKNIDFGSIVVFHDSLKAEKNLRYVLPKVLEYIEKNQWDCKGII